MVYDTVIIGAGPGGMSAAIYASRAELKTCLIEKSPISGGQIIDTYEVDNYPGLPGISGFELADKFREHCDKLGVEFREAEVKKISETDMSDDEKRIKRIELEDGTVLESKTVIAAMGAVTRKLGVPGEIELAGIGVSYCATCDGAFFRNKITAVVGGGDVAVEDAIFLARGCSKVYLIHRRDTFRAAKRLVSALKQYPNIEILFDTVVEEIRGTDRVSELLIKNVKTQQITELEVAGVFVAVGINPNSKLLQNLVETTEQGWIVAGESCETSCPGIFAVGDVRTKQLRQIITAAADGANAVTSVERYLVSEE